MKKIAAALLITSIVLQAQAQHIALGGKAGLNYAQSVITNVISSGSIDESIVEGQTGIGIVFGGFIRGTFGKFIIEPELLLSQNTAAIKLTDLGVDDINASAINKVDIPVLIGYNFFNKFRVMAGPVFSNIKQTDSEPLINFDHITMGYQAGFGFDVSRIAFDARYEGNLNALKNYVKTESGTLQFDSRKNIFQFTLGYKLFK